MNDNTVPGGYPQNVDKFVYRRKGVRSNGRNGTPLLLVRVDDDVFPEPIADCAHREPPYPGLDQPGLAAVKEGHEDSFFHEYTVCFPVKPDSLYLVG